MPGLLAADIAAVGAHPLDHVAVADLGAVQAETEPGQMLLQPEIGHDRRDHGLATQEPFVAPAARDQAQHLVAVDDGTPVVDQHQPVGVAVERHAEIGALAQHGLAQQRRLVRAAALVDVEAIGLDAEPDHLGAQLEEQVAGKVVGGAVGAIDDDLQAVQGQALGEAALQALDIAAARVVDPLRPARDRPSRPSRWSGVAAISASISSSIPSDSLNPSGPNSLIPLSW